MARQTRISDHFNGKRFHNSVPRTHGFTALLQWLRTRQRGKWPEWVPADPGPTPPPRVPTNGHAPDALRVTFVNHSTFLIQWHGVNILTDPIWSLRASPVQFAGPKRSRPPGLRFEDLPKIDIVLLSHDHYDHMDRHTIRRLWKRDRPHFYTGLGNLRRLKRFGVDHATEMDWWDEAEHASGLRVVGTPAQHFSGRTPFDRDSTLWCGFALLPPGSRDDDSSVLFAGDTAFGPHFHHIAQRLPKPRLAILPVGAYKPEWFMGEVHASPSQAVDAHRILGAQTTVASHFGTFALADDSYEQPLDALRAAMSEKDVQEQEFVVLKEGEGREIR